MNLKIMVVIINNDRWSFAIGSKWCTRYIFER